MFKIMSNTIDKRATIRDKIIANLFLASLLLCQCGPNVDVNVRSRSSFYPTNVIIIIIIMSLAALNKYD